MGDIDLRDYVWCDADLVMAGMVAFAKAEPVGEPMPYDFSDPSIVVVASKYYADGRWHVRRLIIPMGCLLESMGVPNSSRLGGGLEND